MEFTLTYDGPLATNGKPAQKHDIRLQLHPQIRELWSHHQLGQFQADIQPGGIQLNDVGGYSFCSVVHERWQFNATLDILMLRPEQPGGLINRGGDIDNRLKTLFDALTIPTKEQIPNSWTPAPEEQPLHCLFQDDRYISSVAVETDRLLAARQPTHVKLVIRVKVQTRWAFGGFAVLG